MNVAEPETTAPPAPRGRQAGRPPPPPLGAETMDGSSANVVPAIALVLAFGAGVGLVNGLVITKLRVNAFIATLGMALILKGFIDNNWDGPGGAVPDSFEAFGSTRFRWP